MLNTPEMCATQLQKKQEATSASHLQSLIHLLIIYSLSVPPGLLRGEIIDIFNSTYTAHYA